MIPKKKATKQSKNIVFHDSNVGITGSSPSSRLYIRTHSTMGIGNPCPTSKLKIQS